MKKKKLISGSLIFLAVVLLGGAIYIDSLLPIITGYAAKNLASAVFVAGRDKSEMESADLNFSFIRFTDNEVDEDAKTVTSRFLWRKAKALYREGFGVTLIRDSDEEKLRTAVYPNAISPGYSQDTLAWPTGNIIKDTVSGIDTEALKRVTGTLIDDSGSYNGNAYGFIVVHKGVIAAESYKPQFNRNTRFLSWSMAKSFTNALTGILVGQGKLDLNKPAGVAEWADDERRSITLNDLLQMQSGLKWNEDYGNRSSVNVMLHCEGDMAGFAIDQPSEFPSGTKWYYSSGTSNIVSFLLRKQFVNDTLYYQFIHKELFNKIGMPDAVMETDPSGTIVGSSYLYATVRDYARFGLLYLNDGVFNNERILPEGWVKYTVTPASDSKGGYGAFFWLNRGGKYPSAPPDMFSCEGHDGQKIFIIPSKDLVVVVVGYSPSSNGGLDFDTLLRDILATLK
jgi:CubicO group peptidase (beta-lactamase class C family)